MIIEWETAIYSANKTAQIAAVRGPYKLHRFYVKRTHKGARHFTGYIDGERVMHSCCETMDESKSVVIREARRRGILLPISITVPA